MSVPVNREVLGGKSWLFVCLTSQLGEPPEQIYPILVLARGQEVGIPVAGIHQMNGGEQVVGLQRLVNQRSNRTVSAGGGCRSHMGNEMGEVVLAGFTQVDLLPDP